jgi:hypothetical protein
MPPLIEMPKKLNMKSDEVSSQASMLYFTSQLANKENLISVLKGHGVNIAILHQNAELIYWQMANNVDIEDLCNILNEVGYKGVLVTASKRRPALDRST